MSELTFVINPVNATTPGRRGEFYVNIVARNGNVLFTSEGYENKSDAKKMIASLTNSITRNDFEIDDKTEKATTGAGI